jgi:hypothetical protein
LKAALNAKVAALAVAEEQLLQERTARQGAEGRLQREQAALADARSALEQERVAREAAQKLLAERDTKLSEVEGELVGARHQQREPGAGHPGTGRDHQGPRAGGRG